MSWCKFNVFVLSLAHKKACLYCPTQNQDVLIQFQSSVSLCPRGQAYLSRIITGEELQHDWLVVIGTSFCRLLTDQRWPVGPARLHLPWNAVSGAGVSLAATPSWTSSPQLSSVSNWNSPWAFAHGLHTPPVTWSLLLWRLSWTTNPATIPVYVDTSVGRKYFLNTALERSTDAEQTRHSLKGFGEQDFPFKHRVSRAIKGFPRPRCHLCVPLLTHRWISHCFPESPASAPWRKAVPSLSP